MGSAPPAPPPDADSEEDAHDTDGLIEMSSSVSEAGRQRPPQQVAVAAGPAAQDAAKDIIDVYEYPSWPGDSDNISNAVPGPCWYRRKVGRMYVLMERIGADGAPKFLCVVGPCWPMLAVTMGLIIGISIAVFLPNLPGRGVVWTVIGVSLLVVTSVSLALTGCTDPGIVRRSTEPADDTFTWSDKGRTFRPRGAVYDSEAQVVVQDIDHFCPWTGTIIADGNLKWFHMFVSSLCCLIIFVALLGALSMSKQSST